MDRSKLNISASNRDSWCSDVPQPLTRIFNPYLTFVFNSTYLIEMVNISGDPDHSDRYITALHIWNNTGQGFAFINDDSGIPKVRSIGSLDSYMIILHTFKGIQHIFNC